MAIVDQATADYEREQENRTTIQDSWADWNQCETPPYPNQSSPPVCAQCVNWQPERQLHLADGTTQRRVGFCASRAAANLSQMAQNYASECRFYEEEIPF